MPHMATWGNIRFWSESGQSQGKPSTRAFIGVSVGKARERRGNSIGLASLNNIGGL